MWHSVIFVSVLFNVMSCGVSQNPVIVQHGAGGAIIEIEGKSANMPPTCPTSFSRRRMWMSAQELSSLECWKASLKLGVDANGNTVSPSGLTAYQPSNGLDAARCLDPTDKKSCTDSTYLGNFYGFLTTNGYVEGKTLDTVAYDWRASPLDFSKPGNYFPRLKTRVEQMFADTGAKVTIIGHSMGAATTAMFLGTYVDSAWKEKYIRMFISVVGAFGGSMWGVKRTMIGQVESGLTASTVREVVSTFPGAHSLVPANTAESKPYGTATLVTVGNQNYSVADLPKLYNDVGMSDFGRVLDRLRGLYQTTPGVLTHCILGKGFKTISKLNIPDLRNLSSFTEEFDDGDQILTFTSQSVCTNFGVRQKQAVTSQTYEGTDHVQMIAVQNRAWNHILDKLKEKVASDTSAVSSPVASSFVWFIAALITLVIQV